jgi:hypothetical protein
VDLFTRADLRTLLANRQGPCVSLFMPTTRGVRFEDAKRWKNLVGQAEERLAAAGRRSSEARDLLRPARDLADDASFWRSASAGLAFFHSPQTTRSYRLPQQFAEQVVVADHFHVKPLLPLLTGDGKFYVLALSQKNVRLLQGTHHTVAEVPLEGAGVPTSLGEALGEDWVEETRTFHTVSSGGAKTGAARSSVFHGQGAEIDNPKEDLLEFAQRVDRGLHRLLHEEHAPLVLAGEQYLLPIYRQANRYPNLLPEAVEGNPDLLSAQQLHTRAWAVVQPHFERERQEKASLYRQLAGTGRTANDPAEVVSAAARGKLQFLFVALGRELWGAFDEATGKVEVHDQAAPGDEDLLNLAAVYALSHKGTVYAVEADQMPDRSLLAAIYRLPGEGERSGKRTVPLAAP